MEEIKKEFYALDELLTEKCKETTKCNECQYKRECNRYENLAQRGKTLYLEKRGCDFFKNDDSVKGSDVGNYRVTTSDYEIAGKDGKTYFMEFTHWERYNYRTTNKRTGEKLKKPVRELVNLNALHVDISYKNENGCFGGPVNLDYIPLYTKADILRVVNDLSVDFYTRIEFI